MARNIAGTPAVAKQKDGLRLDTAFVWGTTMSNHSRWLPGLIIGGITLGVPVISLLFGDALIPRMFDYDKSPIEFSRGSLRENITVVSFRRGNGGYKTLGDVGTQAEALGFKSVRWMSKGMVRGMERGWGVLLHMFESGKGGIFYPSNLKTEARLIQTALTRSNPLLQEIIPLIEAKVPDEYVFVGPETVSRFSILVYTTD